MAKIEVPHYLDDRAALLQIRDGARPLDEHAQRLLADEFIEWRDLKIVLTPKGAAAAEECARRARIDPFTGLSR